MIVYAVQWNRRDCEQRNVVEAEGDEQMAALMNETYVVILLVSAREVLCRQQDRRRCLLCESPRLGCCGFVNASQNKLYRLFAERRVKERQN